jgi:hypothetical protein
LLIFFHLFFIPQFDRPAIALRAACLLGKASVFLLQTLFFVANFRSNHAKWSSLLTDSKRKTKRQRDAIKRGCQSSTDANSGYPRKGQSDNGKRNR